VFFGQAMIVADTVIEIVHLPYQSKFGGCIAFPVADDMAHRRSHGESQKGVGVIRHQEKNQTLPALPDMVVLYAVE
jgi:hypothetical protein